MQIGDVLSVKGCFTKDKFIAGRTLGEIERILGYQTGRMSTGAAVVALLELPALHQFTLAGYTNVPTHRQVSPQGLNIEKLKTEAMASWAISGFERLVKVIPLSALLDEYPPGQGAPQWIATAPLKAKVVAVVSNYPDGKYIATDSARR